MADDLAFRICVIVAGLASIVLTAATVFMQ